MICTAWWLLASINPFVPAYLFLEQTPHRGICAVSTIPRPSSSSLARAEQQLQAARKLLDQLGGERERWGTTHTRLTTQLRDLPNNALTAAAFATYLLPYPEAVRAAAMAAWAPGDTSGGSDVPNVAAFLAGEQAVARWKAVGLPGDTLSLENAAALGVV